MQVYVTEWKLRFFGAKHILLDYQNTKWHMISVFFLQEVRMTMDATMVINIFSGLPGMRNMELAKQPHRPSYPVLPYIFEIRPLP